MRKSVPEGYKTHKTIGFPFPSSAPPAQRYSNSTPTQHSFSQSSTTRELAPFCGLHKIGGWAEQEISSSAPADVRAWVDADEEDMPSLSFSQHTISSSQSSLLGSSQQPGGSAKKRSYEDDVEDDMDAFFDEADAMDAATYRDTQRPIARMKGSAPSKVAQHSAVRILDADDFEEAAFLAPMDGMEVD